MVHNKVKQCKFLSVMEESNSTNQSFPFQLEFLLHLAHVHNSSYNLHKLNKPKKYHITLDLCRICLDLNENM